MWEIFKMPSVHAIILYMFIYVSWVYEISFKELMMTDWYGSLDRWMGGEWLSHEKKLLIKLNQQTSFLIHERGGNEDAGYVTAGYWGGELIPLHLWQRPTLIDERYDDRSSHLDTRDRQARPPILRSSLVSLSRASGIHTWQADLKYVDLSCTSIISMGDPESHIERYCILLHRNVPRSNLPLGSNDHLGDTAYRSPAGSDCNDGLDRGWRWSRNAIVSDH
jgi:hypothetical protein